MSRGAFLNASVQHLVKLLAGEQTPIYAISFDDSMGIK